MNEEFELYLLFAFLALFIPRWFVATTMIRDMSNNVKVLGVDTGLIIKTIKGGDGIV